MVSSDVTVNWDGDSPVFTPKGTLVSIAAGSALQTAYGGAGNVPEASGVQANAAAGGVGSLARSN